MKAMICKQCGAPINPLKNRCEYCGTYYKTDSVIPTIIHVDTPEVQILKAVSAIPNDAVMNIDEESLAKMVHNEIALKMAKALEPNIEFDVQFDPEHNMQVVRGRIRVLPPGFRF